MLSQQEQLTELVKELELRNHIFASDPLLITEKMQDEQGSTLDKLHRRASRIDSNGKLKNTLSKIDTRINAIILIMSIIWCASGFIGLFTLLQANVVNFFYVLICLLGFHTLVLVIWLLSTVLTKKDKPSIVASLLSPSHLIRGKDDITSAAIAIYERQLRHAGMRWYLGKISHQLWLATLLGILFSLVVLLMVRDYNFAWESTLLSGDTIAFIINKMAWLPDLVGFSTPSTEQIFASQQFATQPSLDPELIAHTTKISSYEWAMLLIGSLCMYGIVPRVIAWLICAIMFNRKKMSVDVRLAYYQKIICFWSRKIVEPDDFEDQIENLVNTIPPTAKIESGNKLVVLLEYPYPKSDWYLDTLSASISKDDAIKDFGVIDSRDDIENLISYLDGFSSKDISNNIQILIGINIKALPDRGTMNKLEKIAKHASKGLIVKLLTPALIDLFQDQNLYGSNLDSSNPANNNCLAEKERSEIELRKKQWQTALAKYQIGLAV